MLGIDIGNNELKIAAVKGGSVTMVCEKLPANLVKEGCVQLPDAMAELLRNVRKKNHLPGGECAVVLPPAQVFCRHIRFPAMDEERLRLNLPYEMKDYLSGESDRYYYDYLVDETTMDDAGNVVDIETTAAAILKQHVFDWMGLMKSAGLKMVTAIPQEMAYRNLLRQNAEVVSADPKQDYCIVDIGHVSSRAFFYKNAQHEATKVIEVGCSTIDLAIAEAMEVDAYVAGAYKEANHNHSLELPQCMEVYDTIAMEIMKALNFAGFTSKPENEQHIYYAGGGADILPLLKIISETTGAQARSVVDLLPPQYDDPMVSRCALALGAALQ